MTRHLAWLLLAFVACTNPTITKPRTGEICGDSICLAPESCVTCATDCVCACGDGVCAANEDATSCPVDCNPTCGNGSCEPDEACASCAADCSCSCGDGTITPPEQCDPPDGVLCDARCNLAPVDTALVSGDGLIVQDTSFDGSTIAYLDQNGTLYIVATADGTPVVIATNVEHARFRGRFLLIFRGIDTNTGAAATMMIVDDGSTTPRAGGERVLIDRLRTSDDGHHLYVVQLRAGTLFHDVFLDGRPIAQDARKERGRFTPTNDFLVVGFDERDPNDPNAVIERLRAHPLDGSAPIDLLEGRVTRRFDITPDGRTLLVGVNENGPLTDLAALPITGGTPTTIVSQAGDDGFRFLDGTSTVVFLVPDDPNNPSFFRLEAIGLDGQGRRRIVDTAAYDIDETSADAVVYVTAVDPSTALPSLALTRIDGTNDGPLGARALEEGFSRGGAYFLFRDQVVRQGLDGVGRLRAVDVATGALVTLGERVFKASRVDDGRVVFLETSGALHIATLGGSTSELTPSATSFDVFDTASPQVTYTIAAGAFSGIYVTRF